MRRHHDTINLHACNYTIFSITIYFIRISRPKFVEFQEYFKNKREAESLKRTQLCMLKIRKRFSLHIKVKPLYREKTVYIKTHKLAINRPVDHTGET